ncbi:MAG: hypothetical protein U0176_17980 [Bacteroidia bacterium]
MNQGAQLAIKVVIVCAIFIPYKFVIMNGEKTGFLQDFLVALFAYALAYGVIALIQRGKQNN